MGKLTYLSLDLVYPESSESWSLVIDLSAEKESYNFQRKIKTFESSAFYFQPVESWLSSYPSVGDSSYSLLLWKIVSIKAVWHGVVGWPTSAWVKPLWKELSKHIFKVYSL